MAANHLDLDSVHTLRALSKRIKDEAGCGRAPHGTGYKALEKLTETGELRYVKAANARLVRWSWWLDYLDSASTTRTREPLSPTGDARTDAIKADVAARIEREEHRARGDSGRPV